MGDYSKYLVVEPVDKLSGTAKQLCKYADLFCHNSSVVPIFYFWV